MQLSNLISILNKELAANDISDYCPNGMQVEGAQKIGKIVTGVTASMALIDAAIATNANALLVHHGYFWKGESQPIVGMKKARIAKLLKHDITLLAYHLPLDVHATLGNNAQLGKLLSLVNIQALPSVSPVGIIMTGELTQAHTSEEFSHLLELSLHRTPTCVGNVDAIKRVAWCTGGGQGYIDNIAQYNNSVPLENKIDAFISGEISEQTTHSAIEQDVVYFAAGHHATERYGVKALGEWLQVSYGLDVEFIDIDNPA